jgi:hypothetical protein
MYGFCFTLVCTLHTTREEPANANVKIAADKWTGPANGNNGRKKSTNERDKIRERRSQMELRDFGFEWGKEKLDKKRKINPNQTRPSTPFPSFVTASLAVFTYFLHVAWTAKVVAKMNLAVQANEK